MIKAYVRFISNPNLTTPTLVMGLSGIGNVGRIAVNLLIQNTNARLFAELYSPVFPDYVHIDDKGVCHLSKYEFFHSSDRNTVFLTGDNLLTFEDIPAHYEVCEDILDFASQIGCKSIVALDGVASTARNNGVFVASTDSEQKKKYLEQGAEVYQGDKIMTMSGLLLGLARIRGIGGICLLGSASNPTQYRESSINLINILKNVLGIG